MGKKQIPYFIYTSGEEGLSNIDWGVKFASPLLDKAKLHKEYEKTVQDYGLDLKYDIPQKLGILVLNGLLIDIKDISISTPLLEARNDEIAQTNESDNQTNQTKHQLKPIKDCCLIGFVYRSSDTQANRNNYILIGCLVSDEIKNKCSISDFIKGIPEQNDLDEIACLDKEKIKDVKRPDYLELDFDKLDELISTSSDNEKLNNKDVFDVFKKLSWQSEIKGYWKKDNNNIIELKLIDKTEKKEKQVQSNNEKENKPKGGKILKNTLIAFVILLTIIISSTIASYFIGMINRIFPDKPVKPEDKIEKVEKTKPKTNLVDEIADRITNNIITYNRNNEKLVGLAFLKRYVGDKCELEIGGEFSDSNLTNLTSFSIKRDFEYDIICTENDLRNSIKTFFSNCKEFNKMPRDNFFKAYFEKDPNKLLAENLKVKFNNESSNKNLQLNELDEKNIKNYLLKYFNSLNKKDLDTLKKKFSEQNRIYMPENFSKYILILNGRKYFYKVIELDGSFNARDLGEFFYSREQNLKFYKLPVVSIDDSKNFYVKKDGNYYKFGKVVVSSNKEEAIEEFSRKYFEYIKEKNKER